MVPHSTYKKYRKKITASAAILLSCITFSALGEVETIPARKISLDNFIKGACINDKNFQLILIDELALKYGRVLELPSKDLLLSATGTYKLKLSGDGGDGPEGNVSLSKLFPMSGTETSTEFSISPSRTGSGFSSSFSALVSQPIARNAFGRSTRMHDRILGLENRISRYQIIEAYEDYLATIIGLFYQWYADDALYHVARRAWEENTRLLANIRLRFHNRIAHRIDVDRIQLQTIISREVMDTRSLQYEASRNLVYQALGYKGSIQLQPVFKPMEIKLTGDFSIDFRNHAGISRTLKILDLLVKKGRIEIARSADDLLPSTSLMAGYSFDRTALGGRTYSQHLIYGGLQFTFPFQREKEKAGLKIQRIEQRKNLLKKGDTAERIKNDLKILHQKILQEKIFIKSARERLTLAQRIAAEEGRLYRQARSPLKNLIDARNILEESRLNLVNHRTAASTLKLEWLRMTDGLVQAENLKKTRDRLQ